MALGAFLVLAGGYLGLGWTSTYIQEALWGPPPAIRHMFFDSAPGRFLGVPMHGRWWLLLLYLGFLRLQPGGLALAFCVQRTRNTLVGMVSHGVFNCLGLIVILPGILGTGG